MKSSSTVRSNCEKDFVLNAIDNGIRLDGRRNYEFRKPKIKLGESFGHSEVCLGNTRCLAQVSCEAVKPSQNRPNEGQLFFNLELSAMASPAFETGRPSDNAIEMNRFIERCLRESRPIDLESLCILAGEKVWCLRVDIQVMDDAGNILDCASMAAITALAHFRRPDVTVHGKDITIHSLDEKEPVPLNVHHIPVCVTFGFIGERGKPIVDPTELEEVIIDGYMIMALNSHSEICCAKMCGVPIHLDQIMMCCKVASSRVSEIAEIIKTSLEKDAKKRLPPKDLNARKRVGTDFEEMMITKTMAEPTNIDITESLKEATETASKVEEVSLVSTVICESADIARIGDGDSSAWLIDDEDNTRQIDNDLMIIEEHKQRSKTTGPITLHGSGSSEEEDTMELTLEHLGFDKSKPIEISDENVTPKTTANQEKSPNSSNDKNLTNEKKKKKKRRKNKS